MPGSFSLGIDDVLWHNDKLMNGNRERKILLNSWEGVYLNIKEPEMAQMMADIKSMGGELFVMDDGWFGGKYKRSIDNSPLAFEGKTFSGEYLMQNGLEIPYGHNADWGKANEWASRMLLLETAE